LAVAALYEVDSKATDKYDISLDDKVIAKYCLHCGRYTKGKTAHSSAEHTGHLFTPCLGGAAPSPAPAPSPAAVIASFPNGAPTPPVSAAVAASIPGLDLSSVLAANIKDTVDSEFTKDYDYFLLSTCCLLKR
jgi:hypothetical protein